MRLCRYRHAGQESLGYYDEHRIVPLHAAAEHYSRTVGRLDFPPGGSLLDYLPPDGAGFAAARRIADWLTAQQELPAGLPLSTSQVELLVPLPRPNKFFLLAGNYAAHIEEGGGIAAERQETFPYVFMKPPTTTLTDPNRPVVLPAISPATIDWELELGVIIGRRAKGVSERDALQYVAGYTVVNDISNRRFQPNPKRKPRDKDAFFDWLHGKWFDTFCPLGPCVLSADALSDPQQLDLELRVDGQVKQKFSTAQMVFPVAAVIEFIASFVTLEPGDILSTGTGPGVGAASNTFLRPGQVMEASISHIGTLRSPVAAEGAG